MMGGATTERDLVIRFKEADTALRAAKEAKEQAEKDKDKAEDKLVEYLVANHAEQSARYEGIGYAKRMKPRCFASCLKENQETLFDYLKKQGREDLVKMGVAAPSLSSFVKELFENGEAVPDFINYYHQPSIKIYGK